MIRWPWLVLAFAVGCAAGAVAGGLWGDGRDGARERALIAAADAADARAVRDSIAAATARAEFLAMDARRAADSAAVARLLAVPPPVVYVRRPAAPGVPTSGRDSVAYVPKSAYDSLAAAAERAIATASAVAVAADSMFNAKSDEARARAAEARAWRAVAELRQRGRRVGYEASAVYLPDAGSTLLRAGATARVLGRVHVAAGALHETGAGPHGGVRPYVGVTLRF